MVAEYVPKPATWTYDDVLMHMGRRVLVTKILKRGTAITKDSSERTWAAVKLEEPRVGWIVGCRTLRNGKYVPASGGFDYDGYEPPGLAVSSTVFAVMVVFWPTEKPRPVAPEGISFDNGTGPYQPYTSAGFGEGKERKKGIDLLKKSLAEDEWPRDAKGKFAKEPG